MHSQNSADIGHVTPDYLFSVDTVSCVYILEVSYPG